MLHILFLRAQTITWQNCRNRFWYNYKSWKLEVKNYFFSKIDEFLTSFRFAGTGGSLVLPSDREVSRMSPDATPDVSRAKRTPYPGSGGPQAVRSQKLDRRSQKLGQNSDFSCRVFDFLTFWLRTGNTGLKHRCGCASVVPVASGGTIPALASPCGCPGKSKLVWKSKTSREVKNSNVRKKGEFPPKTGILEFGIRISPVEFLTVLLWARITDIEISMWNSNSLVELVVDILREVLELVDEVHTEIEEKQGEVARNSSDVRPREKGSLMCLSC